VPWRFLDAGQLSARVSRYCRRPKTTTDADVSVFAGVEPSQIGWRAKPPQNGDR
jgi:hypothetical protein